MIITENIQITLYQDVYKQGLVQHMHKTIQTHICACSGLQEIDCKTKKGSSEI